MQLLFFRVISKENLTGIDGVIGHFSKHYHSIRKIIRWILKRLCYSDKWLKPFYIVGILHIGSGLFIDRNERKGGNPSLCV